MGPSTTDIITSFENDQKNTVFSALSEYLSTGQYVDISLVCRGQVLRAHKVVLSSSSKYFKDFFRHQPGVNIIDLDKELAPNDISLTLEDVQLIIGILYCVGTVEISPQRIETLLICAQVLGIPTLISFLKKIRDSIQDGGKGVKKQVPAQNSFLAPALLPTPCHKLARPASDVVYYQSPAVAPPVLPPVPFPPVPDTPRIFSSPTPRISVPVRPPSFPSSQQSRGTSTPTPFPNRTTSPPAPFQAGPLLDLSVVKPLTGSCINTPVPSEVSPVPGPSGLQQMASGVQDSLLSCQPRKMEPESRMPRQCNASRISSASFSSFSLNYLQSPRLKSTDAVPGQESTQQSLDGFDQNFFMSLNTTLNTLQANQIDDLENVLLPHLSMDRADSAALNSMDTERTQSPMNNPLLDLREMEDRVGLNQDGDGSVVQDKIIEDEDGEDDAISSTTPECSRNPLSCQEDNEQQGGRTEFGNSSDVDQVPCGGVETERTQVGVPEANEDSPAPALDTTGDNEDFESSFESESPAKSSVLDLSYRAEDEENETRKEENMLEIDPQLHRYNNDLVISDMSRSNTEQEQVPSEPGCKDPNTSEPSLNITTDPASDQPGCQASAESSSLPLDGIDKSSGDAQPMEKGESSPAQCVLETQNPTEEVKDCGKYRNNENNQEPESPMSNVMTTTTTTAPASLTDFREPLSNPCTIFSPPQPPPPPPPAGRPSPIPSPRSQPSIPLKRPVSIPPTGPQQKPEIAGNDTIMGSIFAHHPTAVRLTPMGGIACTPIQRLLDPALAEPRQVVSPLVEVRPSTVPSDAGASTSAAGKTSVQEKLRSEQSQDQGPASIGSSQESRTVGNQGKNPVSRDCSNRTTSDEVLSAENTKSTQNGQIALQRNENRKRPRGDENIECKQPSVPREDNIEDRVPKRSNQEETQRRDENQIKQLAQDKPPPREIDQAIIHHHDISIDEADGAPEDIEDQEDDSGEIVMNLDQVSGGQKMKFNIPGISQAVTVNFSVEALQEMKNAALRQRMGGVVAGPEVQQSEEISSSQIARGCVEEPGGSNAAAPGSQDQLQAGKGGLKKKNLSRRNLRQKLKSNLKSPARGIPQEEPSSQSSNGMQFLCPICNKTFPSLTQLNKHQKFHMQKCFPCEECHEVFDLKWQYEEHRASKHGDQLETSQCPECPQTFSQRTLLLAHMQTFHKERRTFKCFVCSLDFNQKHNLFTHLSSWHPNEKVPHCPVCMELFNEQKGFESHDCPGAEIRNRSIVCHLHDTPVSFTNRSQLDSHMREEHGTKGNFNVSCCICHKKFLLRKNLIKHLRNVHKQGTNNKHFCPQCGKQFYYKDDLKNHVQVHDGELKHVCKEADCKKAYSTGKALKKHQKLAHEVDLDLVTCKVCKKQLSTPFKLRAHMLVHTDLKPFSCSLCSETFKEQRNVVKHMKLKHFGPATPSESSGRTEPGRSRDPGTSANSNQAESVDNDNNETCRPDSTEIAE